MGVRCAAISTVICRALSSALLLYLLYRKYIGHLPKGLFRPFPWQEAGKLFKVGIPSAGEQMSYSLSMVVVTYFINFLGNDELATRTYGQTITTFVFLFSLAAAQGGAIVIGHLTGMKKYNAAFALGRRVLRISVAVTFVLSFTTACFGHTIFSMLTDNEHIIRMGTIVLWIDIMVEVGRAITDSFCDDCEECQKACPVDAINPVKWNSRLERSDIIDIETCSEYVIDQFKSGLGCSKCLSNCRLTQEYFKNKR